MDLAAPVRAVAIACSKIEPREKIVLTQYLNFLSAGTYGCHAASQWAPRQQLSRGRARDRKGSRARFGLARVWPPAQTCEEITSKKVAARRGLKRRHCRRRNSLHDLLGAKAKIRLAATAHLRSGRTRRAHVAQAFHGSSRKSA